MARTRAQISTSRNAAVNTEMCDTLMKQSHNHRKNSENKGFEESFARFRLVGERILFFQEAKERQCLLSQEMTAFASHCWPHCLDMPGLHQQTRRLFQNCSCHLPIATFRAKVRGHLAASLKIWDPTLIIVVRD
eukprot:scaffold8743_cov174-Ochromonas_danica.AAC.5